MKKLLVSGLLLILTLALASCGSDKAIGSSGQGAIPSPDVKCGDSECL